MSLRATSLQHFRQSSVTHQQTTLWLCDYDLLHRTCRGSSVTEFLLLERKVLQRILFPNALVVATGQQPCIPTRWTTCASWMPAFFCQSYQKAFFISICLTQSVHTRCSVQRIEKDNGFRWRDFSIQLVLGKTFQENKNTTNQGHRSARQFKLLSGLDLWFFFFSN